MLLRRLTLVCLVAALLLGGAPVAAQAAPTGSWVPVVAPDLLLEVISGDPAGTPLPLANGQILLIGRAKEGQSRLLSQRYDPVTSTWTAPVPLLMSDRLDYAVARLADGRALIIGGRPTSTIAPITAVERYDPATDRWEPVAPLGMPRLDHTATLLADGRVLVAGGYREPLTGFPDATAEVYDPARDVWTPAGGLTTARVNHTATRLADGRVLVVGGTGDRTRDITFLTEAEIYDPATGRWTATAPMRVPRDGHKATLLSNGQVLVLGGAIMYYPPDPDASRATAERYDPAANRWLPTAPLPASEGDPATRGGFSATSLPDGQVLVTGGQVADSLGCVRRCGFRALADTTRYDPSTDRWVADAPMTARRAGHQAVLLPGGRVLVVGFDRNPGSVVDPITAEVYTPPAPPSACFAETGRCLDGAFLAYWQRNGGLARNGFPLSGEFRQVLEDGREYTVQYFERVRLEYHPENAPPYDVLLGQFGRRVYQARTGRDADPSTAPAPGTRYFPETGHNLGGSFGRYWEANGGLAQFGYPLTDELKETLEDGQTYTVQYFERARFEYHPENPPPFDVLLGQFGRQVLAETGGGR